ncbi:MAG: hypothetical protein M1524_00300 [Patescibacteria group bacterium]|nr:hypothetical protein [Patescibacteria group bacterium]
MSRVEQALVDKQCWIGQQGLVPYPKESVSGLNKKEIPVKGQVPFDTGVEKSIELIGVLGEMKTSLGEENVKYWNKYAPLAYIPPAIMVPMTAWLASIGQYEIALASMTPAVLESIAIKMVHPREINDPNASKFSQEISEILDCTGEKSIFTENQQARLHDLYDPKARQNRDAARHRAETYEYLSTSHWSGVTALVINSVALLEQGTTIEVTGVKAEKHGVFDPDEMETRENIIFRIGRPTLRLIDKELKGIERHLTEIGSRQPDNEINLLDIGINKLVSLAQAEEGAWESSVDTLRLEYMAVAGLNIMCQRSQTPYHIRNRIGGSEDLDPKLRDMILMAPEDFMQAFPAVIAGKIPDQSIDLLTEWYKTALKFIQNTPPEVDDFHYVDPTIIYPGSSPKAA